MEREHENSQNIGEERELLSDHIRNALTDEIASGRDSQRCVDGCRGMTRAEGDVHP